MKKLLSVLLILSIISCLFYGCSSSFSTTSGTTTPQFTEEEIIAQDLTTKLKSYCKNPESLQVHSISYVVKAEYTGNELNELPVTSELLEAKDFKYLYCIDYSAQNGFGGMNRSVGFVRYTERDTFEFYLDNDDDELIYIKAIYNIFDASKIHEIDIAKLEY